MIQHSTRRNAARRRSRSLLWLALSTGALATSASAINIVLNFNSGQSATPAFDPAASGLTSLFQYAESFYEGVFEDSHTLTVNFWYENLATNVLGSHGLVAQSGGRETEANIRIDSDTSWFIDSTPGNNGEFNMGQIFWQSLPTAQRTDWYNLGTSVPNRFEVGYTGSASTSSEASNLVDMLSVVLHEVGHALGMSSANTATQSQTADGDYDFNPSWVFGQALAVQTANTASDDHLDISHVENTFALMTPALPISTRTLPSHTDLFAMASGSSFTVLNVPRIEYYGGGLWNTSGNWSGNRVPDINDVVVLSSSGGTGSITVALSADAFANSLGIERIAVVTNGFKLKVASLVTVYGAGAHLEISAGGEVEANDADFENSAVINMLGGTLDAASVVTIGPRGKLVSLQNANDVYVGQALNNNGTIQVMGNSTLTFHLMPYALLNLDGMGNGRVQADGGDIICIGGAFEGGSRGIMQVGAGHYIQIDSPWTNWGDLKLNGGADFASRARFAGGMITHDFVESILTASGVAAVDAPMAIGGGQVNIAAGGQLSMNGPTTISGGSVTIGANGAVLFTQQATISPGATFAGAGKIGVAPGASLTLANGTSVGVALENAGRLEVGASPGSASVSLFAQPATGVLHIELGGHSPGTEHDLFQVQGVAALFGTLQVSACNGFVPLPGDQFQLMTYASVTGAFNDIDNDTGFPGLAFITSYGTTALTLSAAALFPGDADLNGTVGVLDLLALSNHWLSSADWLGGDFDGSGFVDQHDLGILAQNWQAGIAAAPFASVADGLGLPGSSVPEPTAIALLATCPLLLPRRRRGRIALS